MRFACSTALAVRWKSSCLNCATATLFPIPTFARELALENPDAFFLSQSGECFHNVTVTGGKQRAEGPLSMKRELRDVLRQLGELEQGLRHEEMRVLTLGREIKDLTSLLDRLESEKREAEKQAMTSGHLLQQLESEIQSRVSERLETSRQELHRLEAERTEKGSLLDELQMQIAAAEQQRVELEHFAAAAGAVASLRERRDQAAQDASQRLARVATLEERHRSAHRRLERIELLVSEMIERVVALRAADRIFGRGEIAARVREPGDRRPLVDFDAERNACETRDGLLQVESEQVRARLTEIDQPCTRPGSCSTSHATVAPSFPRPQPSCSPTRSTWPRPA